jgi:hypothetical protein
MEKDRTPDTISCSQELVSASDGEESQFDFRRKTRKGEVAKDCSRNRHLENHCDAALPSAKVQLKNEHRLSITLR